MKSFTNTEVIYGSVCFLMLFSSALLFFVFKFERQNSRENGSRETEIFHLMAHFSNGSGSRGLGRTEARRKRDFSASPAWVQEPKDSGHPFLFSQLNWQGNEAARPGTASV